MTEELSRTSALASRHTALGSGLEDWNGMGTAWEYSTSPNAEHDAIREAAGMFDMSPLKKVMIRGADAAAVIDHTLSRDASRIGVGQAAYGSVLTDAGTVCDDAIAANNGNGEWMFCHGSGESMERLTESAQGKKVSLLLDDDLHNISLQGPKALELLNARTPMELANLRYFHHQETELFGKPCRISRTGYSGERGYEIFIDQAHVGDIWDNILEEGSDLGVMPCSFTALDKVRIEAALLFFGYDMTVEHTPWEVGLGFTINLNKADYRGKQAVIASKGKERFKLAGIVIDHHEALTGGETLLSNGQEAGVINSPGHSHRLGQSLALCHLQPDLVLAGTRLEVKSDDISCTATVVDIPFFDPQKSRTHA